MGIADSNLSTAGFDYVVAVTQDNVNAALGPYLEQKLPEAILCYTCDSAGNAVATPYATLVQNANNTDPFSVPDGTPTTDPRLQNLIKAGFAFAIKARLGLPPGIPPYKLAPIVALQPDQSTITYTLLFAEFIAAAMVPGAGNAPAWMFQSQTTGTSWSFTCTVNLDLQDVAFTSLPATLQQRLSGMGSAAQFGPLQLIYDLDSAQLQSGFQFNNLPHDNALNTFMATDFVKDYWAALNGQEVLGYAAEQTSGAAPGAVAVTGVNFFVPAVAGNVAAPLTLNYLCAINNHTLPGSTQADFGWNWLDPGEESSYSGAAALNRNTYAALLGQMLMPYMQSNCYSPAVQVKLSGAIPKYSWSMTGGQTPTILPSGGATILNFNYQSPMASSQAGLHGDLGKMQLSTTYALTVTVQGSQMIITQHLVVWLYVRHLLTRDSGNVVDKMITDTYSFGVTDEGQIVVSTPSASANPPTSVVVDKSKSPKANGFLNFWAGVDKISDSVTQWAKTCAATNVSSIPVSAIQNFVFPGQSSFSFADVSFSNFQDLVSHITYVAPQQE